MRQKIIIPGDGETKPFNFRGRAVVIEESPLYETAEDVPVIGFDSGNNRFPIYPRSTYGFQEPCGEFNQITITGTAASEGDEITIISFNEPLKSEINIVYADSYKSVPGTTQTLIADDDAQVIPEVNLLNADNVLPRVVYVTVAPTGALDGIKWALNTDPAQGDNTIGTELTAPSSGNPGILKMDIETALAFRFIAKTNTERPVLNYWGEY